MQVPLKITVESNVDWAAPEETFFGYQVAAETFRLCQDPKRADAGLDYMRVVFDGDNIRGIIFTLILKPILPQAPHEKFDNVVKLDITAKMLMREDARRSKKWEGPLLESFCPELEIYFKWVDDIFQIQGIVQLTGTRPKQIAAGLMEGVKAGLKSFEEKRRNECEKLGQIHKILSSVTSDCSFKPCS